MMKKDNAKLIKEAVEKTSNLFSENDLVLKHESFSDLLDGKFFTATIALPSDFPREYRDSDKALCRVRSIFLSLFVNTNPHGVSGPDDIERTLTVSIAFLGTKRPFRAKTFFDSTIEKHYEFYRFGNHRNHSEIIDEMSEKALDFTQQTLNCHIEA